jgi:hypothetical protein
MTESARLIRPQQVQLDIVKLVTIAKVVLLTVFGHERDEMDQARTEWTVLDGSPRFDEHETCVYQISRQGIETRNHEWKGR